MNQQNTIFMALEQEEHHQQETKNNITCKLCGNEFKVSSYRLSLKRKFCCRKCHYEFRTHYYTCIGCNKTFKPKFRFNPKFCTRKCYNEHRDLCNKTTPKYETHYYCDFCITWIPKKEAKKNLKFQAICPNRNCNNNRLRTTSLISKLNHKRENIKRIE